MRPGNSSRMAASACSIVAMTWSTAGSLPIQVDRPGFPRVPIMLLEQCRVLDVRDRWRLSFAAQSIFFTAASPADLTSSPADNAPHSCVPLLYYVLRFDYVLR